MAVIDKDGNIFDVHAERRLDQRRGDPRRHRHRHERARRAVLARHDARQPDPAARAAALHADAEPRLQGRRAVHGASARPAATTRIRPSCRRSSASSSSGTTGIRTCTRRSSGRACRRCTSTARSGRTRPASTSSNVEAPIPDAVYRGAAERAATTSAGCARSACPAARPSVMIDPATRQPLRRRRSARDCYAMAY